MRIRLNAFFGSGGPCFTLIFMAPAESMAQRGRGAAADQPSAGPAPRLANGKTGYDGIVGRTLHAQHGPDAAPPRVWSIRSPASPSTGKARGDALAGRGGPEPDSRSSVHRTRPAALEKNTIRPRNGDYAGSCMPFGMARNINSPHGSYIIAHADAIAILFEQKHLVPSDSDRRAHGNGPKTWRRPGNGYSTAEWGRGHPGCPHNQLQWLYENWTPMDTRTVPASR